MVAPVDSDLLSASINTQQLQSKTKQLTAMGKNSNADKAKLREAVEGFESIFIQKMWQQMRKGVPKGGMFQSREEQMWQGMYDQELAIKMSQSGGIGLSDMLYKQLSEKLGEASRTTSTKGAAVAPVRDLDTSDNLTKIIAQRPIEQEAKPAAPMDDLYSPVDEPELVAEDMSKTVGETVTVQKQAIPIVKTDTEFMTEAEVSKNVNALQQQILSGADSTSAMPVQVSELEEPAVETDITVSEVSAPKAEQVLGMGGPLEPRPDMATINWPLPGPISSNFGWRNDPFTGKRAWHSGVDIAGKVGDPVAAAWDGKVIFSGEKSGYGKLVVVEHENGWRSYYGHNSELNVQEGDTVKAGKKIAEVGSTGRSTGPHLHFEIRQGELAWNPQQIRTRLMAGLPIGRVT